MELKTIEFITACVFLEPNYKASNSRKKEKTVCNEQ